MTSGAKIFGYTGGSHRIVATVNGVRRPIAWGDDITVEELGSFMACDEFVDVDIERVEDPIAETRLWPAHHGVH